MRRKKVEGRAWALVAKFAKDDSNWDWGSNAWTSQTELLPSNVLDMVPAQSGKSQLWWLMPGTQFRLVALDNTSDFVQWTFSGSAQTLMANAGTYTITAGSWTNIEESESLGPCHPPREPCTYFSSPAQVKVKADGIFGADRSCCSVRGAVQLGVIAGGVLDKHAVSNSALPSSAPTSSPSPLPTLLPSLLPSMATASPSLKPTLTPSVQPTEQPTDKPSTAQAAQHTRLHACVHSCSSAKCVLAFNWLSFLQQLRAPHCCRQPNRQ